MYICEIRLLRNLSTNINYGKVRDHCHCTGKYRGTAHSICNLKFSVSNKIPAVYHRGSNYHFIIKELPDEFEGQFDCIEENKKRTFSVPIKKQIMKIDKNGNETVKTISSKIQFIDITRFMASSLSNLIDNLLQ